MFVKTARSFDPHDRLVREYHKLEPYINGMVKNGRRNLRHEVWLSVGSVNLTAAAAQSQASAKCHLALLLP